ncbi:MAG TPA: tetratricopeptide repeat protein, partial [Bryobacteraceae bacterium]|nr:tetratricopeptide repeat protein [Bryobacteraceae bacterium]
DVTEKSPHNGQAFINYALALVENGEAERGYGFLTTAAGLIPQSPEAEVKLAHGFDLVNHDREAEEHFKRAVSFGPSYSLGYSAYSQWLAMHNRMPEAFRLATRAAELNPEDLVCRHVLMDIYSAGNNWPELKRVAAEALRVNPNDPDGLRSRELAQASIDSLTNAERDAKANPTIDDYLRLSVEYFKNNRFADSIKAAREATKLRPDSADAYANIAAAAYSMGDLDQSIAALREVVRLAPEYKVAQRNLELLLSDKAAAQHQKPTSK